jgi:hypothetical protein
MTAPPWTAALDELFGVAESERFPVWEPGEPLAVVSLLRNLLPIYPDTPVGMETILSTGVDGEHWSAIRADTPSGYLVVMTAPRTSPRPNLVVGESVLEFLCLGCVCGYWALSALTQDLDVPSEAADEDEEPGAVLARLRIRLGLSPWPDVPTRLAELERRHGRPVGRVPRDVAAEEEAIARGGASLEWMKAALERGGDPGSP